MNGLLDVADRCDSEGRHEEAESWRRCAREWSDQQAAAGAKVIGDCAAGAIAALVIVACLLGAL